MDGTTWILVLLSAMACMVTFINTMTSIAVMKATDQTSLQRTGQLLATWLVPVVGAMLVLHLIAEFDRPAIPDRWLPNQTINGLLLAALQIPARHVVALPKHLLQQAAVNAAADHLFGHGDSPAIDSATGSNSDNQDSQ
jgi:hypothetical protein